MKARMNAAHNAGDVPVYAAAANSVTAALAREIDEPLPFDPTDVAEDPA
jgi:hypothetical protein